MTLLSTKRIRPVFGLVASLLLLLASVEAKWKSEFYSLKAGWNSIYLFVDASYTDIDTLLTSYPQIEEVWRWQPDGLSKRILTSPEEPVSGPEWAIWRRGDPQNSAITRLYPNYAYLIKVKAGSDAFTLDLKGEATLPRVVWRTDGVNLIGFPVAQSPSPTFNSFLDNSVLIASANGVYEYNGGELGTGNPAKILNPGSKTITRNKAYWINIGKFSRYYGPIRLEVMGGDGLKFNESTNSIQLLATNISDETVSLAITHESSEPPPSGQKTVEGKTPLLLKRFDNETAKFSYETVSQKIETDIEAGESRAWTFSVNRAAMDGSVGDLYASTLAVTGGSGTKIHLPVEASVTSKAGLWVGEVMLDQVASLVRTYERDPDTGETLFDENGTPILANNEETGSSATNLPMTAQALPLRVLLHVNESGQTTLLSHAYVGTLALLGDPIGVTTSEDLLDTEYLESAVRLSSIHLPTDTFEILTGGVFQPGQSLSGDIVVPYDSSLNPFVHAYHPDHDNLDARGENKLPAGAESYTISRNIKLDIDEDGEESNAPDWGSTFLTGTYQETLSGVHKNAIRVRGQFQLYRVSDVPTLTTP